MCLILFFDKTSYFSSKENISKNRIYIKAEVDFKFTQRLYTRIKGMKILKVNYIKEDKLLILEITEEIDHYSCEKIKKRADYEIQIHIPKKVIFDFKNVNFMDSSGIGMIIGRYKLNSMFGGKTSMINVKPAIKKVFEMSGILKLIPIEELGGTKLEECI